MSAIFSQRNKKMVYLFIAVLGYLLGSVNSAIVLVGLKFHKDVRTVGSGNAGATNAARTYGSAIGALTLLGDMAKAVVAGLIGYLIAGENGRIVADLFCIVGHCWPVFFRFKGGKGMAVAAGTLLLLDWKLLILIAAFFVAVFLCWRRVSLSTVLSVLIFPPLYYWTRGGFDLSVALGTVICVIVVIQHRQNIKRLFAGTEPKFSFPSKKTK